MSRILSNRPGSGFVLQALQELIRGSRELHLAAPYFDEVLPIKEAVQLGKPVNLLVGLSSATDAEELGRARGLNGVSVRYLTHRFHAKIFVFDGAALLGSANLTSAGLTANREAVIRLDRPEDRHDIDELRALFAELWEAALVLTDERFIAFRDVWRRTRGKAGVDADVEILKAVEHAEPPNVNVASMKVGKDRIFKNLLHRQVHEEYGPAFREVMAILSTEGLRRPDIKGFGLEHEANRFLNWVRLENAPGDTWQDAPERGPTDRREEIIRLGRDWQTTQRHRIPPDYYERLETARLTLGDREALGAAGRDELVDALMALHAFSEQLRFVKGGVLPPAFWRANNNDDRRVKATLDHLLFDRGDFVDRLHDILYHPKYKLGFFGKFCALELFGTIRPDLYPPMNGRMAKALKFLGFKVGGA